MSDIDDETVARHRPYSQDELFRRFEQGDGTGHYLLILYSIVIGLNAKTIVDVGTGMTTGALRAAALKTGGTVYSYDQDARRRSCLLPHQDEQWKLVLAPSSTSLPAAPQPIDMVMHDGAHDYVNVKRDLDILLPKMRQFGIICVHDTQQPDLSGDMLAAISDATRDWKVSLTNLPFNCGMAIIRVEEGRHAPITPAATLLANGQLDTRLNAYATCAPTVSVPLHRRTLVPIKIKIGHWLRQAGLKR